MSPWKPLDATDSLAIILEATTDFVGTADATGHVLYVNRAGRRMVGLRESDDVTALTLSDLHASSALRRIQEEGIPSAIREGSWEGETALITRDGREIPVSQVILAHKTASGRLEFLSTIARDVTDRKQAEEAIRKSEERYRNFLENSSEAIWRFELDEPVPVALPVEEQIDRFYLFGYLAECNDSMARMYGLEGSADLVGARLGDMLIRSDPKNVDMLRAFIGQSYRLHEAESHEVDAEGHSKYFVNNFVGVVRDGLLLRAWGTQRDVTAGRRAEEALKEREARYRSLFRSSPISIWEEDFTEVGQWLDSLRSAGVADLGAYLGAHPEKVREAIALVRVLDVNEATLALFEAESREQLLGGLSSVIRDPALPRFAQELVALWEGRTAFQVEVTGTTLKGNRIDYILHWAAPEGADGRPDLAQVVVAITDITERKRAEDALRQAQKMESLGILAGGVAHDFNNLLVAILGQSSLALSKLPAASPARSNIDKAVKASQRAADLTRQMLAYSGRGHFEIQPMDLNGVIGDNLRLLEVAVPKNVRLVPELASALPLIDADVGQIQQVVMNLVLNAAEAAGNRPGVVRVRTGVRDVEAMDHELWRLTGEPLKAGRHVFLEVVDNGSGMDPATLGRIFDPFFTTKFTGRGLGLAAVLGIVRGHHGGLQVESEPGLGTTFRLYFPAHRSSTVAVAPSQPTPGSAGHLILIIDDEASVRETVREVLTESGFAVLTAPDAASGLACYRERPAHVALVLLDLSMPDAGGEETFRELKRVNPEVKVLLTSGFGEAEATDRFKGAGLAGFIQKPYTSEALVSTIRACLGPGSSPG